MAFLYQLCISTFPRDTWKSTRGGDRERRRTRGTIFMRKSDLTKIYFILNQIKRAGEKGMSFNSVNRVFHQSIVLTIKSGICLASLPWHLILLCAARANFTKTPKSTYPSPTRPATSNSRKLVSPLRSSACTPYRSSAPPKTSGKWHRTSFATTSPHTPHSRNRH